ncbi:sorbosone dehydrogenase family protein [Methylocaldum sp.]|uniref:PQQ-dependent sugar dehydrogenase n=1 Tax=Methylocaldum sp. TaxID=1969727 RepID=UPI002D65CD5A|nr:sorbosone dehydrogenase family protein [Methylocaldum sp.]HYE34369.1 sorbosone dehydrogenase family protein [Methylocaldum sp.]
MKTEGTPITRTACSLTFIFAISAYAQHSAAAQAPGAESGGPAARSAGEYGRPKLPPPYATPSAIHFSKVIGWPEGKTPVAPPGFKVTLYADRLDYPRWLFVLPNGDVLVAEARTEPKQKGESGQDEFERGMIESATVGKSANRITLLRDANHDGVPELRSVFLTGLNQQMGMALRGDTFYVANTDGVVVFPYRTGETQITAKGRKILELPAGGYNNHWNRNLLFKPDGNKLYIAVGSDSNVGEHGMEKERRRAGILEVNPDGSGERVYASGLRNPQGLDFEPVTGALWTAVNERDELGDELVPDFITSVREGGFYGWPYSYFGQHEDPRRKGERPDLVAKAIVPDYAVGAHTASLGLAFYKGTAFPEAYRGGAFVGQHGSWNRSILAGYKVLFVPFKDGKPNGPAQDFLTGFIAGEGKREVYGRPVGLAALPDGSLLVADDAGGKIWRVSAVR